MYSIADRMSALDISAVNELHDEQFEWTFGNVIELCPQAAVKVREQRPFGSVEELCRAFDGYLDGLDERGKVVVLNLHPDLAGRLASSGQLTRESAGEQRSAGLQSLSADHKYTIDHYNEKYKAKFGFPFVTCARENKVQSIMDGLTRRYNDSREREVLTAINEVKKICRLRILDIVR